MKLLLLAAIVAAASAIPKPGQQKCTWGPSYWCQGYKQAKECHAIEHCKQKVWIMKPEDACQDCENVLNEVKAILSKNTSQHEVIVELEALCQEFAGQYVSECKALVDSYAPAIFTNILAFLNDTKQVCTSLGLCATKGKAAILAAVLKNSIPLNNHVTEYLEPGPVVFMEPIKKSHPTSKRPLKKVAASPECILCEFVMRELDTVLSENATKQEIKDALDKVCSLLPSTIRTECINFIDEYERAILEILEYELDPQKVCTALKLCAANLKISKPAVKTPNGSPECVLCEFVMSKLDTILGENSTEEEIENALDKVCTLLPSTVTTECENFVKQYTPILIQLLQQISPKEVCTALGICTSSAKVTKVKKTTASPECILCEFVMDKLENLLKQNATEAEIEAALDKVCSLLPSTVSKECTDFVNKYTPQIINLLTHAVQPSEICTLLQLCTGTKRSLSKKVMVKSDEICTFCKTIVTYAKMFLDNNSTEDEIIQALDKMCSDLPDQLKTECTSIVNEYGKMILDMLLKQTPDEICKEIGLCAASKKLQLNSKSETYCFLGASYWCESKENAMKCDALQHCTNHVW